MGTSLFDGIAYIIGASLLVFGIPSIIMFALTDYLCRRIERR